MGRLFEKLFASWAFGLIATLVIGATMLACAVAAATVALSVGLVFGLGEGRIIGLIWLSAILWLPLSVGLMIRDLRALDEE